MQAQSARALASVREAETKRGAHLPAVRNGGQTAPTSRLRDPANPMYQTEADLDKALSAMDPVYIQCRDFGHSWVPSTARWVQSSNAYESTLRCQRCGTGRTRWLTRTGGMVGGGYDYAEGYLVKGLGRLTGTDRDRVRLASILQVVVNPKAVTGTDG